MKRIAILGLGLMGGSLGLALKARGFRGRIAAYARRPETRTQALGRKAVDQVFDNPADAVEGADLAVFCTPILSIPHLVAAARPGLKRGAIVTDVGSTKARLSAAVEKALAGSGAVFVGSHPIAGSEQQGLESARADLYKGAIVVVTSSGRVPVAAVKRIAAFWKSVGAIVRVMTAEEHDRIMARTSHLPHVVSALLAGTVGREGRSEDLAALCGPGFRDTTRIAEGSPVIWRDIIETNREALGRALKQYGARVDSLRRALDRGDYGAIVRLLEEGREGRRALVNNERGKR